MELSKGIMPDMGFDEKLPPDLRLPLELKWILLSVALTRFSLLCLSEIASEIGMDRARELVYRGFQDLLNVIGGGDFERVKELLNLEGNDTITAARLMIAVDGILGNVEEIVEASPHRTVIRNVECRIWENRKHMGLEEKFPCVLFCYESVKALNHMVNPKIKVVGEKPGKLVGIPEGGFNKHRLLGDECCEVVYVLEE